MKELSIEQKARAYDKAFERAKRMFSEKELNYIFSELTESEDEKIKKRIIQAIKIREKEMNEEWSDEIAWIKKQGNNLVENGYTNNKDVIEYAGNYSREIWHKLMDNFKNIKDYHIGCNDVSDIVLNAIINTYNWLEKQGEQGEKEFTFKSIPRLLEMIEPTDRAESYCQKLIDSLVKKGYTTDAKIVKEVLKGWNGEDVPMAVMDEQKPINKIQSKFKVGDWVVSSYGKVNQIIAIDEDVDGYTLDDGNYFSGSWKDNYHLWSIQDAKDGDVLADDYGIYIFDRFDEHDERCFLCIGVYQYSQKVFKNEHMLCSVEVHPATKEQRDLLFQKMHEAGYTFDFKKKEIKKLKFKVGDEIITENEESLTITRINEEGYWSNDLFICSFDDSAEWKLVEQKYHMTDEDKAEIDYCFTKMMNGEKVSSTWSEEDEDCLSTIIAEFSKCAGKSVSKDKWMRCNDFLNSLRDRIQPKQEWSKEDEEMIGCLNNCLDELEKENGWNYVYINDKSVKLGKIRNWIKSLKPQLKQEWSKEDEKRLKSCLNILQPKTLLGNTETINTKWLKSLKQRIGWKPSEEPLKESFT